ncbi:MAG: rod shape-determining protein MreD [Proteobacteria bacterium]|nr:rod shape-determining protein MreD [Pseudomonadota bacterium]MCL2307537.1 rod shape-determining protein MreD [Pseudomonadota bacterium]
MKHASPPPRFSGPSLQPINPNLLLPPPRLWFITVTLLIALLFDLFPLSEMLTPWRPELVALTLLYWCIWAPRFIGVSVGFLLGLVMDVANGSALGQHAFAFTLLAFGADYFRRRVASFPMWQQMVFVALLLELCALVVFLARMMSGGALSFGVVYFIVPLLTALLWPLMQFLLQWQQRRAALSD